MSAGVCGKRVGFEEIFGSSPPSSSKRSRWSNFGSLGRSGSEDLISTLLQMFPELDSELVKSVLKNHDNKIEDAAESLRVLSFSTMNERSKSQGIGPATNGNCATVPGESSATSSQMSEENVGESSTFIESMMDGSKWVDLFVHEMTNALDLNDARRRAAKILEAFERNIAANTKASKELELVSLREHLQGLLNDNQILKRAVAIQHERHLEQEEKTREVQHLKGVLSQYQEQVRNLELSNYALKLHLQRAQESSSFPGRFPPDVC